MVVNQETMGSLNKSKTGTGMRAISRRQTLKASGSAGAVIAAAQLPGRAHANIEQTLRLVWPYDANSLDPLGMGVQRSTWTVSLHVYDRLLRYDLVKDESGRSVYNPSKLVGEFVASWHVVDDGKAVDFHIREHAQFHDGSPVTAEDVRWSIARAMRASAAAAGLFSATGIKSERQLQAVNERPFRLSLPTASRYIIPYAAIFNKNLGLKHVTEGDPWASEWLKTNSAGGGAYKVSSFRPEQVVLTLNENWRNGFKSLIGRMLFQSVPEATMRVALVERDAADAAMEIPPADSDAVAAWGKAQALAVAMPNQMEFLGLNSGSAPFNNTAVHQAVAWALPYDDICQKIYQGRGKKLYGSNTPPIGGEFPQLTVFNTIIEKAKSLLGGASGFTASLIYSTGKAGYFDQVALAVKENLSKIGIQVNIGRLPGSQFDERIAKRTFDVLVENRTSWFSMPDYWMRTYYTGTGTNILGNFQSTVLQDMLNKLRGDASESEYAARTKEMIELVLDEVPLIPTKSQDPQHPYTQSLVAAVPAFTPRADPDDSMNKASIIH
ncbi:ABC transporter substrate-binding protein [Sinorhizobium chiapasense]|uniref:ABC transporter substrate-binding protein n=1 Tax=Sinorhizobium chiapasense TaxID=501572 RepID=A0ABZ2BLC4_9HYPH